MIDGLLLDPTRCAKDWLARARFSPLTQLTQRQSDKFKSDKNTLNGKGLRPVKAM
jgi:hypothetical protein